MPIYTCCILYTKVLVASSHVCYSNVERFTMGWMTDSEVMRRGINVTCYVRMEFGNADSNIPNTASTYHAVVTVISALPGGRLQGILCKYAGTVIGGSSPSASAARTTETLIVELAFYAIGQSYDTHTTSSRASLAND